MGRVHLASGGPRSTAPARRARLRRRGAHPVHGLLGDPHVARPIVALSTVALVLDAVDG